LTWDDEAAKLEKAVRDAHACALTGAAETGGLLLLRRPGRTAEMEEEKQRRHC